MYICDIYRYFVAWEDAQTDARLRDVVAWPELKGRERCFEKCLRCYRGDVARLLDVARQSIVFERLEDLSHCLALIRQDADVKVGPLYIHICINVCTCMYVDVYV